MTNCIFIFAVAVAAAALLQPGSSTRNCRSYSMIINFGDSVSDTGSSSALFGQLNPPYGETFFHHPAGRASDGRLIIDFLAERLKFPYLSGYLESIGSNFTRGVNFANAASTIRYQSILYIQSPVSLTVQFKQFIEFQTRSQQARNQGGVFEHLLPDQKSFSDALYTVDIGINDLLTGFIMNLSAKQVKEYVPDLIQHLSKLVKDVYARGGRSFLIHNTGPLGCLPYTLVKFPVAASQLDKHGCSMPHNDVSNFFNLNLKKAVEELRILLPRASIKYVDIYGLKYSLISNAKKLGFEDPLLVCCGFGGGRYNFDPSWGCGFQVNGTFKAKSCRKPITAINWDGLHYTEAAHKWIFNRFVHELC